MTDMSQLMGYVIFRNGKQKNALDNFITSSRINVCQNVMLELIYISREPAKLESKQVLIHCF